MYIVSDVGNKVPTCHAVTNGLFSAFSGGQNDTPSNPTMPHFQGTAVVALSRQDDPRRISSCGHKCHDKSSFSESSSRPRTKEESLPCQLYLIGRRTTAE